MMRYGSVCSGIEAATAAWHPIGWEAAWYSEVAAFPKAVLAHHYPSVPDLGDMNLIEDMIRDGKVEAPDVLVGGTPCTSFSVAGVRKSMSDERGVGILPLTYVRIANAIDDVRLVRGQPGVITVWENVPGVLNTKDNAFGCLLGALAGEDVPLEPPGGRWTDAGFVLGPKRATAWRCQDAQYSGLAQRRKRVFVVSGPRDWFRPQEVLFEWEGIRRDTPPSRAQGQGITSPTQSGVGNGAKVYDMRGNGDGQTVNSLVGDHASRPTDYTPVIVRPDVSVLPFDTTQITSALNYSKPKDGDPCHPLASTAHPPAAVIALQDVREIEKRQNGRGWNDEGISYTVDAAATQGVAYGCDLSQKAEGVGFKAEVSACVAPGTHPGHGNHVVTESVSFKPSHYTRDKDGAPSEVCPPLTKEADKGDQDPLVLIKKESRHADAKEKNTGKVLHLLREEVGEKTFTKWGLGILVSLQPSEVLQQIMHGAGLRPARFSRSWVVYCALSCKEDSTCWLVQSLREAECKRCSSQRWEPSKQLSRELKSYLSELSHPGAQTQRFVRDLWEASKGIWVLRQTLSEVQNAWESYGCEDKSIQGSFTVRRLTAEECEFLQGFPRGYTRIPWKGKPPEDCPDGPRYAAIGNSMAVTVMAWIGQRINTFMQGREMNI